MFFVYLNNKLGFNLFDNIHLIWLIVTLFIVITGCTVYLKLKDKHRNIVQYTLAYGMLVLEVVKIVIIVSQGKDILYYLPIHLCGLAIFLMLIYAHTKSTYCAEILYAVTLPGSVIALITPGWSNEAVFSFLHIHSFVFHIIILLFPLLLVVSKEHRPTIKRLVAPIIFLAVLGPCVYVFNKWAGTNYMFLNWPISNTPIMTLANWFGEPGYIFGMFLVLILVWILMYAHQIKQSMSK